MYIYTCKYAWHLLEACIILRHIMSHYVILCIISYHIISYHIILYHIMPRPFGHIWCRWWTKDHRINQNQALCKYCVKCFLRLFLKELRVPVVTMSDEVKKKKKDLSNLPVYQHYPDYTFVSTSLQAIVSSTNIWRIKQFITSGNRTVYNIK